MAEQLKILFVGNMNAGKTSLLHRLCRDNVPEMTVATIGFEYSGLSYEYPSSKETINMNVWDAGGMERFRSIVGMYYRGISMACIVVDNADPDAESHVKYWIPESRKHTAAPLLLIVNKTDIPRDEQYAHPWLDISVEHDVCYVSGSAKEESQEVWMERLKPFLLAAGSSNVTTSTPSIHLEQKQEGREEPCLSCCS
jgi:small GTP-binding protein